MSLKRAMLLLALSSCTAGGVSSDEEAELAYVGLDQAVGRAMRLGLQGFSEATNANISEQVEPGDLGGTMTVGGKVDQGNSANKTLNLEVRLDSYQDVADLDPDDEVEWSVVYDSLSPASLDLKLAGVPDGTFSGSLVGTFSMTGDLEDVVGLELELDGALMPDPDVPGGGTKRQEGMTAVSGTVTTEDGRGVYEVDLTI